MNKRVQAVLVGYENLDAAEKREFVKTLNELLSGKDSARKSIVEGTEGFRGTNIALGPIGGGCPCCNR